MNEWMNNYSYRLGTSEHDNKWGVKRHMWTPHLTKWGVNWPPGPAAPRALVLLPDDIAWIGENANAKVWRLLYAYSSWTPGSASHSRSHISPWCFAAEQNVNSVLHFDIGRLCRYLFSRNTALNLLTSPSLRSYSDCNGIAAGSLVHDYCGSPDTLQGSRTPTFTLTSASCKRMTTIWDRKKANYPGNWHTVCHT